MNEGKLLEEKNEYNEIIKENDDLARCGINDNSNINKCGRAD